jgi:hypothetical protein
MSSAVSMTVLAVVATGACGAPLEVAGDGPLVDWTADASDEELGEDEVEVEGEDETSLFSPAPLELDNVKFTGFKFDWSPLEFPALADATVEGPGAGADELEPAASTPLGPAWGAAPALVLGWEVLGTASLCCAVLGPAWAELGPAVL